MNGWTKERRERQAELIRNWQPWAKSTGPKTEEGKARVGLNAWKGLYSRQMRELTKQVNAEIRRARELIAAM